MSMDYRTSKSMDMDDYKRKWSRMYDGDYNWKSDKMGYMKKMKKVMRKEKEEAVDCLEGCAEKCVDRMFQWGRKKCPYSGKRMGGYGNMKGDWWDHKKKMEYWKNKKNHGDWKDWHDKMDWEKNPEWKKKMENW